MQNVIIKSNFKRLDSNDDDDDDDDADVDAFL